MLKKIGFCLVVSFIFFNSCISHEEMVRRQNEENKKVEFVRNHVLDEYSITIGELFDTISAEKKANFMASFDDNNVYCSLWVNAANARTYETVTFIYWIRFEIDVQKNSFRIAGIIQQRPYYCVYSEPVGIKFVIKSLHLIYLNKRQNN